MFPGITAHLAPGHTPGCLVFVLHAAEHDVIFSGDAAKNRAELVSGTTDMTYDAAISKASIDDDLGRCGASARAVSWCRATTCRWCWKTARPKYIDKREAAITAWYGDDMETTTLFKLTL